MYTKNKTSKLLGFAMLFQAILALVSEAVFLSPLIVANDISKTMVNIATDTWMVYSNILAQSLTALGIVFLAVVLYQNFKKYNKLVALTALSFFIVEAALLTYSRVETFSLVKISQEFVATGSADYLLTMGRLSLDATKYAYTLHMLAFSVGAILFYYLILKSKIMPKGLALWGLLSLFPCIAGTIIAIYGMDASIMFHITYAPFEFFIGFWFLFRGIRIKKQDVNLSRKDA